VIKQVAEKGRKLKVTMKKKYVYEAMQKPSPARVSNLYVIVISNQSLSGI
jgi:hypothetical protein